MPEGDRWQQSQRWPPVGASGEPFAEPPLDSLASPRVRGDLQLIAASSNTFRPEALRQTLLVGQSQQPGALSRSGYRRASDLDILHPLASREQVTGYYAAKPP